MRNLLLIIAVLFGTPSYAVTVATGQTAIGDTGGIVLQGPAASVAANPFFSTKRGLRAYSYTSFFNKDAWVWAPGENGNEAASPASTYEFRFDLTGYDLNTANLTGNFAVDNFGTVKLNGNTLLSLEQLGDFKAFRKEHTAYFHENHEFGASLASLFKAGENILTFEGIRTYRPVSGAGGSDSWGMAADVSVTADVSPVPLPAGLVLILSGLGGLALVRRKKG